MGRKKIEKEPAIVLRSDVYEGNPLVQARKEFNLMGMKIFLLGLRTLNPHFSEKDKKYDTEFKEVVIPPSQLVEIFGGNTNCLHTLKAECKRLFDTIVEFNRADGGFMLLHLFRVLEYKPRDGLHLRFEELLRPYLLDLLESKGFTKIDVEQIFFLTSTYAIRIVELLLQYQNIPEMKMSREIIRRFTLEELKFALNVPKTAYEGRFDNFCKKVIDSPVSEINKKTLYQVSFKVLREGWAVKSIEFKMDLSKLPSAETPLDFGERALAELKELGFTEEAARDIWKKCASTEDCLKRIVTAKKILRRQKRKNAVENELGFLRKAIVENWNLKTVLPAEKPPKVQPPKSTPKAKLSETTVEMIKEWLNSERTAQYVPVLLKDTGLTVEEFRAKYE